MIRDVLPKVEIFTKEELEVLNAAQLEFEKNTEGMTELKYRKEFAVKTYFLRKYPLAE